MKQDNYGKGNMRILNENIGKNVVIYPYKGPTIRGTVIEIDNEMGQIHIRNSTSGYNIGLGNIAMISFPDLGKRYYPEPNPESEPKSQIEIAKEKREERNKNYAESEAKSTYHKEKSVEEKLATELPANESDYTEEDKRQRIILELAKKFNKEKPIEEPKQESNIDPRLNKLVKLGMPIDKAITILNEEPDLTEEEIEDRADE